MVLNSNYEGVKAMIYNEKVDINVLAGTPSDTTQEFLDLGDKPLDICAQIRHSPDPSHVRQGGSREVARYRRNVEEIITLLQQKGAKESKGYFLQMHLKDAMGIPDFLKISSGLYGDRKWYGPQRWIEDSANTGVWPMKLGHAVDNIQNVTVETEEVDPVWLL